MASNISSKIRNSWNIFGLNRLIEFSFNRLTGHSFNSLQILCTTVTPSNRNSFPKRKPKKSKTGSAEVVENLEVVDSTVGAEDQTNQEKTDCHQKREFCSMSLKLKKVVNLFCAIFFINDQLFGHFWCPCIVNKNAKRSFASKKKKKNPAKFLYVHFSFASLRFKLLLTDQIIGRFAL